MIAGKELRRNWRMNWLGRIQEFADFENQRRLWLNPNQQNLHFTFVEYMECYFDDLAVFDDVQPLPSAYSVAVQQGLVTEEEAAAVEPFHAILGAYVTPGDDDYDHGAILRDPRWGGVVSAAKEAQSALLPLLSDPDERRELKEVSKWAIHAGARG